MEKTQIAVHEVVTDRDISELIGIAQFLQGVQHWEAQASSKILAEFTKKLLDAKNAAPAQAEPSVYVATLKSKAQIKAEIPREAQGWWADVCPGETLELRDATASDIARCHITEGQSRDPADYLCELPARGALVARIAIASIKAKNL